MNCPYRTTTQTVERILDKCRMMNKKPAHENVLVVRDLEVVFQNQILIEYFQKAVRRATQERRDDDFYIKEADLPNLGIELLGRNRDGFNTAMEVIHRLIQLCIKKQNLPLDQIVPYIKRFVLELCTLEFRYFNAFLGLFNTFDDNVTIIGATREEMFDRIELTVTEMRINIDKYPHYKNNKIIGGGLCPALTTITSKPNGDSITVVKYLLEITHDTLCSMKE